MNEKELQGSFTIIRRDSLKSLMPFFNQFFLDVYACQEDMPRSSFEGYRATIATMKYPRIGTLTDDLAKGFFEACAQFKPQPRENWHVPVQSGIPTLSFGSLFDIQTPLLGEGRHREAVQCAGVHDSRGRAWRADLPALRRRNGGRLHR